MSTGEGRDKDRRRRLERLEKRIVTHLRLARESMNVAGHVENSSAVIVAQQEMIEILVAIIRDQNETIRSLAGADADVVPQAPESEGNNGHAAPAARA